LLDFSPTNPPTLPLPNIALPFLKGPVWIRKRVAQPAPRGM